MCFVGFMDREVGHVLSSLSNDQQSHQRVLLDNNSFQSQFGEILHEEEVAVRRCISFSFIITL